MTPLPWFVLVLISSGLTHGFGFSKQQIQDFFSRSLHFQRPLWTGPNLTRQGRRDFKLVFIAGLISLEVCTELYVRLPGEWLYGSNPAPIESLEPSAKYDVIIFPGAGGPDQYTEALRDTIIASDLKKGIHRPVYVYDWLKWRGSFLRAAFDSQSVGRVIGSQIAKTQHLQNLHVIGISVGAFAADTCVKTYQELSSTPGKVHLTLLDPFTSKGVFGYGWGLTHFGVGADVVEDYLNVDDPVPTTNEPVVNAYTLDVTQSEARQSFRDSTHSWPVAYLANHWNTDFDEDGNIIEPSSEAEPKGAVVLVP